MQLKLLLFLFPLSFCFRFLDDEKYCGIGCDECDKKNKICYECDDGYYLNGVSCQKCVEKCEKCLSGNSCYECEDDFVIVTDSCLHKRQIPNYDDKCIHYDSNYQCLLCDDLGCEIKGGKCQCDKKKGGSKTTVIVVVVIVVILLIIGGAIGVYFFLKKRREKQGLNPGTVKEVVAIGKITEEKPTSTLYPTTYGKPQGENLIGSRVDNLNDPQTVEDVEDTKNDKNEKVFKKQLLSSGALINSSKASNVQTGTENYKKPQNSQLISSSSSMQKSRFKNDYPEEPRESKFYTNDGPRDNNNPGAREDLAEQRGEKCGVCGRPNAIFKLGCGCYLCSADGSRFSEYIRDPNGTVQDFCPICGKVIDKVKLIHHECGICHKIKDDAFTLSCGCNFELCNNCSKDVIKTKFCPNCKKEIIENVIPLPPADQSFSGN